MNNLKCLFKYSLSILFIQMAFWGNAYAGIKEKTTIGKWSINLDKETRQVNLLKNGVPILNGVSVRFNNSSVYYNSSEYTNVTVAEENVVDVIGSARKFVIQYKKEGAPTVDQIFYVYPEEDFFMTEVYLTSVTGKKLSTNYIAPLYTTSDNQFLPQSANNRLLFVPFDNDGFITYGSLPLSQSKSTDAVHSPGPLARDTISFEVTSIFNGDTQAGLVLGSVEHDTWKSAIRMTGSRNNRSITKLECYSGASHSATRDEKPHGYLKDTTVKSAKMFVGFFNDWRFGMEKFGETNAAIIPKREWTKGTPFGWNSWGGMSTHVNYEGVLSASDFVKKHLQGKGGFGADGVVFVGLDSYWDNLNWEQLEDFARHCVANGQIPGIYWTPFNDWFPDNERDIEGNNGYKYSQSHLKVNGQKRKLYGAGCMDPTAPATLSRINFFIDKFKAAGFKYLKLDFLTAGMVEADKYYNKDITTGTQAFNYGMKHLRERCGDDMFIVESIAPLFPYQYANARRVSCDAWGEMWHTNYMMNSLSFGWWLDRVYAYNDPDHLVMGDRSEAENMSRITTGAVTGYFMIGDNLTTKGSYVGTEISQEKVKTYAVNERVNAVVRLGRSFRPAYGHKVSGSNRSVDLFTLETEDAYYIAYFNYDEGVKEGELTLNDLGIDPETISGGIECWSGNSVKVKEGRLSYNLPKHQAEIYHLYKK
ncbi:hypothetical protein [Bacteroides sp. HPS0048]|uniref:hypothetical protein n=1 Tax=Bacteroides sp. HPS0048 TaxID=1078089 RepID=UPI003565FCFF